MLQMNLLVVDTIHPKSETFVINNNIMGVKIKETGDSKLDDSPEKPHF